jgi:hypothetical protein
MSDDKASSACFHRSMQLTAADTAELAAVLPLAIELESYRERLIPLACAVLQGESRRTIDKRRELVLPDVWDGRLRTAALDGLTKLRAELDRKLALLELARADLEQPVRTSKLARLVVDRVLAELIDNNDQNIAALESLERELEALPPDDRVWRAALAARGAFVAARIPANEVRAGIVRAARATDAYGLHREGAAERGAVLLAEALATDGRRAAVREWARIFAAGSAEHVPLVAEGLRALAVESASADAGSDLLWIQACLGLTMEAGLGLS